MPETSPEKTREFEPDFRGPVKSRSCTDVLCLFLFIAFLAGWGVVGYFAFALGNPDRLVHPTDSHGRICGLSPEVIDRPFLFFFDLTRCASPAVLASGCPTPQVCVANCPNETFVVPPNIRDRPGLKNKLICKDNVTLTDDMLLERVLQGDCAAWYIKSTPVAGRCIPLVSGDDLDQILVNAGDLAVPGQQDVTIRDLVRGSRFMAELVNARQVVEGIFQDFRTSWWIILIGLAVAMLASLLWIVLMRWMAALMVWLSILVVLALQGFGIYYCYIRYEDLKDVAGANVSLTEIAFTTNLDTYFALRDTWLIFMIILAVSLAILLLILIFLRNRIRIAIALIAHASKAVGSIMSSLFFPIVPWVFQVAVIGYFIAVAVYLASVGGATFKVVGMANRTDGCTCPFAEGEFCLPEAFSLACKCKDASCQFFEYGGDKSNIRYLQIYNLFAVFWGLFFATAFGEMVLAGAFASWYWAFDKSADVPAYPLTQSFFRTIRYHLGTVAFGSLIISIIRMIRVLLEYLDRKMKQYQDNVVVKVILCCCKCCFWCLEKFMKFVNRNAYIMTAIYGTNFCSSAKNAFFLLLRNVARVVVLDKVTDFLLFLGRMVVVGGIAIASFFVFSGRFAAVNEHIPTLNYYLVPVITTTLGAYFIASLFFNVYAMAVDTLFLCFLEDCERNDGSPGKPYFMSKDLMQILGKKNNF